MAGFTVGIGGRDVLDTTIAASTAGSTTCSTAAGARGVMDPTSRATPEEVA